MGPRIFSVREAESLLPALESAFKAIDDLRHRLRRLKGKLDVLEMLWGDELQSEGNPDHREFVHHQRDLEALKQDYESAARRFPELEVVLKSVDAGLVDFYGVIDSRLVFLCWKRGEAAVEFYHAIDSGFDGRQAIAHEHRV